MKKINTKQENYFINDDITFYIVVWYPLAGGLFQHSRTVLGGKFLPSSVKRGDMLHRARVTLWLQEAVRHHSRTGPSPRHSIYYYH